MSAHKNITQITRTADDKGEDVASIIDNIKDKLNAIPAGKIIKLSNGKQFITGILQNN